MMSERGSALPLVVGLAVVSFVVLALAVEIAVLGLEYRETAGLADAAAETGAAMVDIAGVHHGAITLDGDASRDAALNVIAASGIEGLEADVVVAPAELCVELTRPHRDRGLAALAFRSVTVSVRACAVPATG